VGRVRNRDAFNELRNSCHFLPVKIRIIRYASKGMGRSGAARLVVAGASIAVTALTLFCCSDFEGEESSSGALPESSTATNDAPPSTPDDGNVAGDPPDGGEAGSPIDAGKKGFFLCGNEKCSQAKGEICCMFREGGTMPVRTECVIGNQNDCQTDPGETRIATSLCDDETDCDPGQVCCHSFNGMIPTCGQGFTGGRCVPPGNCFLCGKPDGGESRIACDETKPGQCPTPLRCMTTGLLSAGMVATSHCIP